MCCYYSCELYKEHIRIPPEHVLGNIFCTHAIILVEIYVNSGDPPKPTWPLNLKSQKAKAKARDGFGATHWFGLHY